MLENTKYRLMHGLDLTVVYYGGSLTEGAGASSYSKCWAGMTTEWLRSNYPLATIKPVDSAIGGTGSTLATFRCERDVCSHHPDLVFFEYSVNDSGGAYRTLVRNADAIIRKIRACNPFADIVMVFTVTGSISEGEFKGEIHIPKIAHAAVALHYGDIPMIDIGEPLRKTVVEKGNDWKLLASDTVHPGDEGYSIYMQTVASRLKAELDRAKEIPGPIPHPSDSPFEENNPYLSSRLEDCTEAELLSGFRLVEKDLCGHYDHYIEATEPGAELSFSFEGNTVGLFCMQGRDSGYIAWSVDGDEEKLFTPWDSYCKHFDRIGGQLLVQGLNEGKHTLRIRVTDKKEEDSAGYAIRIGAFMVR